MLLDAVFKRHKKLRIFVNIYYELNAKRLLKTDTININKKARVLILSKPVQPCVM